MLADHYRRSQRQPEMMTRHETNEEMTSTKRKRAYFLVIVRWIWKRTELLNRRRFTNTVVPPIETFGNLPSCSLPSASNALKTTEKIISTVSIKRFRNLLSSPNTICVFQLAGHLERMREIVNEYEYYLKPWRLETSWGTWEGRRGLDTSGSGCGHLEGCHEHGSTKGDFIDISCPEYLDYPVQVI